MANIKFTGVHKSFGSNKIITDFNLMGKDDEFLVLVGPSGCGKSTLLRMIAGLEKIDEGEIFINDQKINDLHPSKRQTAMVFQSYALYPHMNVYENMSFGLKIEKKSKEEIETKVMQAAKILKIEELLERKPKQLSGGQRQRVSIARTLVMKPKFVICDEPTSMLDVSIRISIMDLMLNLAKELDVSYLYITHDLAVARYMCNRIAVMFNGKIVEIAETEELLQNPIHPYTKRLISSIPIPDPKYVRERYEINFDELDKIVKDNPNEQMVDVGNNHFVATHETKEYLIES